MATEVFSGGLGEIRALSTASGGTALSTTATYIPVIRNTEHLFITPRNFATAVVAKVALNPYLVVFKTTDRMGTMTDYSNNAQDGAAATVVTLSSLGTEANGDWLLIGAHEPFRGVYVDMTANVNGTASVLTVYYWQDTTTDAWASLSATDGTDSAGATFGQDGLVYWTVPTDWKPMKLADLYTGAYLADGTGTFTGSPIDLMPGRNTVTNTVAGTCTITLPTGGYGSVASGTATVTGSPKALTTAGSTTVTVSGTGTILVDINSSAVSGAYANTPLFWTKWVVSAALDSSATAQAMLSANRSTAYAELLPGQCLESRCNVGPTGIGCIEALTDAGTANLIVNGATNRGAGF